MPDVVIENPVLNSPFEEPCRHFRFGDAGITNEIFSERRGTRRTPSGVSWRLLNLPVRIIRLRETTHQP
jgi:hypothetical protein